MKIAKFAAVAFFVVLPLTAQKDKAGEEGANAGAPQNWPVKIFQVKYANVFQLSKVFNAFGAIINEDTNLKVLTVRAPKEVLSAIEDAIKRLDVPQPPDKNIVLDAYLLM